MLVKGNATSMLEILEEQVHSFSSFISESKNGIDPFSTKFTNVVTSKTLGLGKSAQDNDIVAKQKFNEINASINSLTAEYDENKTELSVKKRKYMDIQKNIEIKKIKH